MGVEQTGAGDEWEMQECGAEDGTTAPLMEGTRGGGVAEPRGKLGGSAEEWEVERGPICRRMRGKVTNGWR